MEKDWQGYRDYQLHMETAKKVHGPLKKGAKDYDVCVCWNDWGVLRLDDTDITAYSKLLAHIAIGLSNTSEEGEMKNCYFYQSILFTFAIVFLTGTFFLTVLTTPSLHNFLE